MKKKIKEIWCHLDSILRLFGTSYTARELLKCMNELDFCTPPMHVISNDEIIIIWMDCVNGQRGANKMIKTSK